MLEILEWLCAGQHNHSGVSFAEFPSFPGEVWTGTNDWRCSPFPAILGSNITYVIVEYDNSSSLKSKAKVNKNYAWF